MTDKTRLKSRTATAEDVRAFFGREAPQTIRARVLEIDGVVAGIAGYYMIPGCAVVFSDMGAEIPKAVIWRESKAMMERITFPAICIGSEGSGPFLERLGWTYAGPSNDGEVYKWQH